jgi:FkbM family methyltransferase
MYDGRRERKRHGYTQNLEEKFILEHCSSTGRFLDIGAHDGVSFSSTRALLEKGWTGVYVEPDPYALKKLRENTTNYPQVRILPVAIGNETGKMTFYSSGGDMIGSLDKSQVQKWKTATFHEVEVDVMTLSNLQQDVGTNFDFLNLDIEGLNWEIFSQIDWNVWKPKVVCIEYDNKFREMCEVLYKHGYAVCYVSPENIVGYKISA